MSELHKVPTPSEGELKVYPTEHKKTHPDFVRATKDAINEEHTMYSEGYETKDIHRRSREIVDNGFEWFRDDLITEEELKTYLQVELTKKELQSYTDSLTELKNRLGFLDRLSNMVSHGKRNNESVSVLYIDLDGFKATNDEVGHNAGDEVLRVMGEKLRKLLRAEDIAARLGGDEFTIAAHGDIEELKKRILEYRSTNFSEDIDKELKLRGFDLGNIKIGFSIGSSSLTDDVSDVTSLMKSAEDAMKKDKEEKLQRNPNAPRR